MISRYRGYRIELHRSKCMAGYGLLYYSVNRESDKKEMVSDFTSAEITVREMIQNLKTRIDNELSDDDPWEENNTENNDTNNKYPLVCYRCGLVVGSGEGYVTRHLDNWKALCTECDIETRKDAIKGNYDA